MSEETPKVVAVDADPAATEKAQRKAESKAQAATLRAGAVAGLQNELAYLERQPVPNERRIADVKKQLDHYSKEPKAPKVETAAGGPGSGPTDPPSQPADDAAAKAAAAKKAAAEKRAAARKAAAAKKAAAAAKK